MLFSLTEAGLGKKTHSSGSHLEPEIGFSRAVRVGQFVAVSGTAPILATVFQILATVFQRSFGQF